MVYAMFTTPFDRKALLGELPWATFTQDSDKDQVRLKFRSGKREFKLV